MVDNLILFLFGDKDKTNRRQARGYFALQVQLLFPLYQWKNHYRNIFLQAQENSFVQVFNLQYLNFKAYEIPDKGDFLLILYCIKNTCKCHGICAFASI